MKSKKTKTSRLRAERLEIRLEKSEKAAFQMAADASGLSLSSWIRERLRKAARYDLEEAGEQIPFLNQR